MEYNGTKATKMLDSTKLIAALVNTGLIDRATHDEWMAVLDAASVDDIRVECAAHNEEQ